jgi:serine/threonine protein kinase
MFSFIKAANRRRELPERTVRVIFVQLEKAMQTLHAQGIVLRDINLISDQLINIIQARC